MMELSLDRILEAREKIAPHVLKTPLLRLHALDEALGCRVYVKCECMQKTGSFKIRGATSKVLSLSREEIDRGFVAASSGNHGRGLS